MPAGQRPQPTATGQLRALLPPPDTATANAFAALTITDIERKTPAAEPEEPSLMSLCTELLQKIATNLSVRDICRLQRVNRRLNEVLDQPVVWKPLYQSIFRYDHPIMNYTHNSYAFRPVECTFHHNPWRSGCKVGWSGVHVRPDFDAARCRGERRYFATVHEAIDFQRTQQKCVHASRLRDSMPEAMREKLECYGKQAELKCRWCEFDNKRVDKQMIPRNVKNAMVFVHEGVHDVHCTDINWNVAVIGAASGEQIYKKVELRNCYVDTLFNYEWGAENAYLGHVTLRVRRISDLVDIDLVDTMEGRVLEKEVRCVKVNEGCSPLIEMCRLASDENRTLISVGGKSANPTIRWCQFQASRYDSTNTKNLYIHSGASGQYEYNTLYTIGTYEAKPTLRVRRLDQIFNFKVSCFNPDPFTLYIANHLAMILPFAKIHDIRYCPRFSWDVSKDLLPGQKCCDALLDLENIRDAL